MSRVRRAILAIALGVALTGCAAGNAQPAATQNAAPMTGESLFNANCSACHGARAAGTQQGPPLVHKIYEPSHHGDESFVLAMQLGSKQHHWNFGDMPKQPQVTTAEARQIIAYVRALQREAGIR